MVTFDQLMLPLMKALVNLGGSASVDEMYEEVVKLENFELKELALGVKTEFVEKVTVNPKWFLSL